MNNNGFLKSFLGIGLVGVSVALVVNLTFFAGCAYIIKLMFF